MGTRLQPAHLFVRAEAKLVRYGAQQRQHHLPPHVGRPLARGVDLHSMSVA